MVSVRSIYTNIGIDTFYSSGQPYTNPHAREVRKLLFNNHLVLPLSNVLDLACGPGLVTKTLTELGYSNIIGIDPFLNHEYTT
jgi:2-polyprenyl-3-methyl-5-hydroxy-6-metoxy-1,4-benzoquinol methylase